MPCCNCGPSGVWPADFDGNGRVNKCDRDLFYTYWENGNMLADINGDGGVDGADAELFEIAFAAASGQYTPCPSGSGC